MQPAGLFSLATIPMTGCFGGPCSSTSDVIIFAIVFVGGVAFVGYGLVKFFD